MHVHVDSTSISDFDVSPARGLSQYTKVKSKKMLQFFGTALGGPKARVAPTAGLPLSLGGGVFGPGKALGQAATGFSLPQPGRNAGRAITEIHSSHDDIARDWPPWFLVNEFYRYCTGTVPGNKLISNL